MTRHPSPHLHRTGGSPLAVAFLVLGFAALHSVLASRVAKEATARVAGVRARNGLYRFGFIIQSAIATVLAVRCFCRLPDRELYRVPQPWSWGLRAVQLGSLLLL